MTNQISELWQRLSRRDQKSFARLSSETLLNEQSFLSVLRIERKRVTRSGQRFVLMLLDFGPALQAATKNAAFERFLGALLPSIRETDYKGWYQQGSILGVIFTDIGEASYSNVLHALLQRVGRALSFAFDAEQIEAIKISFNLFPEPLSNGGSGSDPDFTFYRDLIRDLTAERSSLMLKRALDVVGSLLLLILLLPLLVVIAIAIKLSSSGPVLFRQERIGQYFKPFTFLKFRSMKVNSDNAIHKAYVTSLITASKNGHGSAGHGSAGHGPANQAAVFKIANDPRVTKIGRFLRTSSLDELPQLLNVLRGQMTLVGPRPCVRYELEHYAVWHRQRIFSAKPGITGLWQVKGRSRVGFDDMVRLDIRYIQARSFWLDVKILLQTVRAVVTGAGAY